MFYALLFLVGLSQVLLSPSLFWEKNSMILKFICFYCILYLPMRKKVSEAVHTSTSRPSSSSGSEPSGGLHTLLSRTFPFLVLSLGWLWSWLLCVGWKVLRSANCEDSDLTPSINWSEMSNFWSFPTLYCSQFDPYLNQGYFNVRWKHTAQTYWIQ